MKKFIGILLSVITAFSVFGMIGCGDNTDPDNPKTPTIEVDKNKTQIIFNFYNGGHGSDWVTNAAIEWNKTNDKYQIITAPDKEEWYSIKSKLESGTCSYDIIHNTLTEAEYARGYLEDLSDVWNATAKGEDVAIKTKFKNPEAAEAAFGYNGGHFAIPCFDTFSGFVYDHELFRDNKFLIGADGQLIKKSTDKLSAGRDGIEGTVDDGQPVNMAQYELMIGKIKSSGYSTYLWTGKFGYYLDPMFWSIFFDYEGKTNSETFLAASGEYTNRATNEKKTITADNANEIFDMTGYKKTLDFIDDYVCDPTLYNAEGAKYGTSHTDAQKYFVYGNAFDGNGSFSKVAFLYEGNWWEREAIANFNSLAGRGMDDYKYGTRDYRYMIPPALDENAASDEIPLVGFSTEPVCVKKQTDPEKRAAIVDFLRFFYTDAQIKKTMADSNGCLAFNVDLTDEDNAKFTRFTRNVYDLYYSDKTYVVSLKYPSGKFPKFVTTDDKTKADARTSQPVAQMLRGAGITTNGDADKVFADTKTYYAAHKSDLIG